MLLYEEANLLKNLYTIVLKANSCLVITSLHYRRIEVHLKKKSLANTPYSV